MVNIYKISQKNSCQKKERYNCVVYNCSYSVLTIICGWIIHTIWKIKNFPFNNIFVSILEENIHVKFSNWSTWTFFYGCKNELLQFNVNSFYSNLSAIEMVNSFSCLSLVGGADVLWKTCSLFLGLTEGCTTDW